MKINGIEIPPNTAIQLHTTASGRQMIVTAIRGRAIYATTIDKARYDAGQIDLVATSIEHLLHNLEHAGDRTKDLTTINLVAELLL